MDLYKYIDPGYILPVLFLWRTLTILEASPPPTHPRQAPGITSNTPLPPRPFPFPISANPTVWLPWCPRCGFPGVLGTHLPLSAWSVTIPAPISSLCFPWSFYPMKPLSLPPSSAPGHISPDSTPPMAHHHLQGWIEAASWQTGPLGAEPCLPVPRESRLSYTPQSYSPDLVTTQHILQMAFPGQLLLP